MGWQLILFLPATEVETNCQPGERGYPLKGLVAVVSQLREGTKATHFIFGRRTTSVAFRC